MGNPAPRRGARPSSRPRSTPSAPKMPFASRPPGPAWTGVFVRKQTGLVAVSQFTFARWPRKALRAEFRVVAARSVRGIDRPYARAAIAARFAAGVVIGVLDAVEKPPRSGCLTLLVARKRAIAEAGIFIALNAKRIAGADGLGRRAANHRQSTGGQQSQNDVTHENLSSAAAALLIDSLRSNPSRSGGFPSTHDVAQCVTGISIRGPAVRHREGAFGSAFFGAAGKSIRFSDLKRRTIRCNGSRSS